MLIRVLGTSGIERTKSIAICAMAALLGLSLWQVSTGRSASNESQQSRVAAAEAARGFAVALTTYDYAHLDNYIHQVAAATSGDLRARVAAASKDLAAAKASSIGDVSSATVARITSFEAEVLVFTSQVVSGRYVVEATRIAGLLDVTLVHAKDRWVITDFRWLLAPVARDASIP
jgi:hypothetical protein